MLKHTRSVLPVLGLSVSTLTAVLLLGCQSSKDQSGSKGMSEAPTAPAAESKPVVTAAPRPSVATEPAPAAKTAIRIKAGITVQYTDSSGNVWLPDQGFADGESYARANDLKIANTKDEAIYRTERYGMTSFSYKLPNGKYTVKLHFAETFEEITGPGLRVFSFEVGGRPFKDFDIFVKAGGANRAYIESVSVDVVNGKLEITFKSNIQNTEINGIEIIPGA